MFYDPATDKIYKDARATGIMGLNADNCGDHGLVVPATEARPALTVIQRASLNEKPTNVEGAWVRQWIVTTMDAAQISLSRAQFAIALAGAGIITADEAEVWAARGELPQFATDAITNSGMTAAQQMAARIKAKAAVQIDRTSPIVALLQGAKQQTDAQVDALFYAGAVI
jgi:hypothetical protein